MKLFGRVLNVLPRNNSLSTTGSKTCFESELVFFASWSAATKKFLIPAVSDETPSNMFDGRPSQVTMECTEFQGETQNCLLGQMLLFICPILDAREKG
jgi:hypothetical protein